MKRAIVINNTLENPAHAGCYSVMKTLERELWSKDIQVIGYWPVSKNLNSFTSKVKEMKPDLIIVNGEGTIHNNQLRKKAQWLIDIAKNFKNEIDVPYFLINSTIYNLTNESYESLKFFDLISVREKTSQKTLETYGIKSFFCPDFSFFSEARDIKANDNYSHFVTDSVIQDDTSLLNEFALSKGYTFLPMSTHKKKKDKKRNIQFRIQNKFERTFFKKYRKNLDKENQEWLMQYELENFSEYSSFIKMLDGSKGIITGRFHTATLCILKKTPFISLPSNTPKISIVLNDIFNDEARLIDRQKIINSIEDNVEINIAPYSDSEIQKIDNYIMNGNSQLEALFQKIDDMS